MRNEYGPRGLVVVGVTKADTGRAREFASENGVTYPVLAGAGDVFDAYGVTWVPAAKLVGPDGKVVSDSNSPEELEKILAAELGA